MAYEPEAAPAPEEPDPESGPATETTKVSQQQANYRMGNRQRSCGLCANFTGSAGPDPFKCTVVDGQISPYGYSDEYTRQDNPFLAGEQAAFTEVEEPDEGEVPAAPQQPQEQFAPQPGLLQIGNKRY